MPPPRVTIEEYVVFLFFFFFKWREIYCEIWGHRFNWAICIFSFYSLYDIFGQDYRL